MTGRDAIQALIISAGIRIDVPGSGPPPAGRESNFQGVEEIFAEGNIQEVCRPPAVLKIHTLRLSGSAKHSPSTSELWAQACDRGHGGKLGRSEKCDKTHRRCRPERAPSCWAAGRNMRVYHARRRSYLIPSQCRFQAHCANMCVRSWGISSTSTTKGISPPTTRTSITSH